MSNLKPLTCQSCGEKIVQTMTCRCTRVDAEALRLELGDFVRLILSVPMSSFQADALTEPCKRVAR